MENLIGKIGIIVDPKNRYHRRAALFEKVVEIDGINYIELAVLNSIANFYIAVKSEAVLWLDKLEPGMVGRYGGKLFAFESWNHAQFSVNGHFLEKRNKCKALIEDVRWQLTADKKGICFEPQAPEEEIAQPPFIPKVGQIGISRIRERAFIVMDVNEEMGDFSFREIGKMSQTETPLNNVSNFVWPEWHKGMHGVLLQHVVGFGMEGAEVWFDKWEEIDGKVLLYLRNELATGGEIASVLVSSQNVKWNLNVKAPKEPQVESDEKTYGADIVDKVISLIKEICLSYRLTEDQDIQTAKVELAKAIDEMVKFIVND